VVGHLSQHVVDGPEADDQVVSMVTIAKHRVETSQPGSVALDDDPASGQRRPDRGGIEDVVDSLWGAHGRPSVGAAPSSGNGGWRPIATRPTLHRIS
jgi:hypothetical protein